MSYSTYLNIRHFLEVRYFKVDRCFPLKNNGINNVMNRANTQNVS